MQNTGIPSNEIGLPRSNAITSDQAATIWAEKGRKAGCKNWTMATIAQ
jgi:hypothetical protein